MLPASSAAVASYEIGGFLGRGQFATVNLATHTRTGKQVAIKKIDGAKMDSGKIQKEIDNQRDLKHPNIVALIEVVEHEGNLLIVLEHAGGGDLFELIVARNRLPEDESKRFFRQIIAGINFCHSNYIVHRDLKPENILLDHELNVKLADFGLSADISDGKALTESCGSPNYAAPELLRKNCSYKGPEVDVWACGCVLYAMLTGTLPFDAQRVEDLFRMIKSGTYRMPGYMGNDTRHLITQMLIVDASNRISVAEIMSHTWLFDPSDSGYAAQAASAEVEPREMRDAAILTQMVLVSSITANAVAAVKARSKSAQTFGFIGPVNRQGSLSCGSSMSAKSHLRRAVTTAIPC